MTKLLEKTRTTMPSVPPIPESWYKARGILKKKRKALEKHLKDIRNEWDR